MKFNRLHGHLWTVTPYLIGLFPHRIHQQAQEVIHQVVDDQNCRFPIQGYWYTSQHSPLEADRARTLVLLLPGVASHPQAYYYLPWIQAFLSLKYDVLSLSLRGASGLGCEYYHAGLTQDLHMITQLEEYAHYTNIIVMGASLGGQIVSSFACENTDARVKAAIALCPPIDMLNAQQNLDHLRNISYRHAILTKLKQRCFQLIHNAKAEKHTLPFTRASLLTISSFYQWDKSLILPRFGFTSVEDYYDQISVIHKLNQIKIPTYMSFNQYDPMIPAQHLHRRFQESEISSKLRITFYEQGGHLGFPMNWRLKSNILHDMINSVTHWLQPYLS